jgi:peptidoglycan/xylan/chitin deacetylase (PgdA/CDA1 family)
MRRVLVLMYHIVAEPRSGGEARYCCAPARFEAQMRHLRDGEIELVSLDAIGAAIEGRAPWPEDGVAVTFDDGFADTFANALPVLERYRIPATMFAVSDRIGDTNRWMSERGFPERRLMSAAELREMSAAGVTIGSHTCTHPRLPSIGAAQRRAELCGSKARLEDLLGRAVTGFAYPYGLFDDDSRLAVEEAGYRFACSTRSGFNGADADRYLLRRVEIYGGDNLWRFRQKLKFGANEVSNFYPLRYYAGRLSSRLGF